jgi:hydroxymethylbilane synthase (EC 2.5.1.61)
MTTRSRIRGTLTLATRGSDLALKQATSVQEALMDERYEVDLIEVETRGDQIQDELIHQLGKTGAFVRSLDKKVLDSAAEADAAVHSMKDMPTDSPDELVVAGIPQRAPPGDLLLTADGQTLSELPAGAVIGTSSLRRQAQLLAQRGDITVEPLRGNVDTRVEKLLAPSLQTEHEQRIEAEQDEMTNNESADGGNEDEDEDLPEFEQSIEEWFNGLSEIERRALERSVETEYDAIVLAEAGLQRSGLMHHIEYDRLDTATFVPAPGQGAIAITTQGETDATAQIREAVDHPRTRVETTVERTVLAELGGGCIAPIGVHATLQGEYVHVSARILSGDGTETVSGSRNLPVDNHADAAVQFANKLAGRGADELIAAARVANETDDEDESDE